MRTVHWLFVVSAALFLSGIGFIVAGARGDRRAPAAEEGLTAITPVASVKQIMTIIVAPATATIFDSVMTSVTAKGIEEKAPQNDSEWEEVEASAAVLVESGHLMLIGGRAVDNGDWLKMSQALIEAGTLVMRATQAKNTEQLLAAGEALNRSCESCHRKYQRGS